MSKPKAIRVTSASPTWGWDLRGPFDRFQGSFECWAQGLSAFTGEIAHFAQARLREDMGAWAKLAACKSAGEAFECQTRIVQKAADDYFDEINKISRLAAQVAHNALGILNAAESEHVTEAPEARR